jgi:hypothetical protein
MGSAAAVAEAVAEVNALQAPLARPRASEPSTSRRRAIHAETHERARVPSAGNRAPLQGNLRRTMTMQRSTTERKLQAHRGTEAHELRGGSLAQLGGMELGQVGRGFAKGMIRGAPGRGGSVGGAVGLSVRAKPRSV